MQLITITAERILNKEAAILNLLFDEGLPLLHLRKPCSSASEIKELLEAIHPSYYQRIVVHDHFEMIALFGLKGAHLNRRNPDAPNLSGITVSRSCHAIQTIRDLEGYDYLFLSPVFDSISKQGYNHAFTPQELRKAGSNGIINNKIIALGGIHAANIPLAAGYGFGGVAVLGALWGEYLTDGKRDTLLKRFQTLTEITGKQ
ncbi:MAG: thiamine phosphate synthase [Bacteroidales bacterium]|nr:thiamine phosphate synthase [Bacteroidales bacterium]MDD4821837.1 thiamine phosphate synthase [Bacteroidales bacterium]